MKQSTDDSLGGEVGSSKHRKYSCVNMPACSVSERIFRWNTTPMHTKDIIQVLTNFIPASNRPGNLQHARQPPCLCGHSGYKRGPTSTHAGSPQRGPTPPQAGQFRLRHDNSASGRTTPPSGNSKIRWVYVWRKKLWSSSAVLSTYEWETQSMKRDKLNYPTKQTLQI